MVPLIQRRGDIMLGGRPTERKEMRRYFELARRTATLTVSLVAVAVFLLLVFHPVRSRFAADP